MDDPQNTIKSTISNSRPTAASTRPLQSSDITNPSNQFFWSSSAGGNNHIYEVIWQAKTWDEANAFAQAKTIAGVSGHLVTITSAAENAFVRSIEDFGNIWLGATDRQSDGQWKWVTGPEAGTTFWNKGAIRGKYSNWFSGEPNNYNGRQEDAVVLGENGTFWNDMPSSDPNYFVVEYSGSVLNNNTAPTVSIYTPADASSNALISSNIVLTFSETIQRGSGAIEIRSGSPTGTLVESINVATGTNLSISGSTLTIDPKDFLAPDKTYFVKLPTGSIKDFDGNSYAGTSSYDFKTASAPGIFGTSAANSLTGTAAVNTIYGLGGADIINGGKSADTLWGGSGKDTFVFAPGDSPYSYYTDAIMDYSKGPVGTGDIIDFKTNLKIGGSNAPATARQASINQQTGVATFVAGSETSLNPINEIASRFTAATDSIGEFALFKVGFNGDYCLFISDGSAGLTANDVVVQLVGVSSISSINLTSGNLTITG